MFGMSDSNGFCKKSLKCRKSMSFKEKNFATSSNSLNFVSSSNVIASDDEAVSTYTESPTIMGKRTSKESKSESKLKPRKKFKNKELVKRKSKKKFISSSDPTEKRSSFQNIGLLDCFKKNQETFESRKKLHSKTKNRNLLKKKTESVDLLSSSCDKNIYSLPYSMEDTPGRNVQKSEFTAENEEMYSSEMQTGSELFEISNISTKLVAGRKKFNILSLWKKSHIKVLKNLKNSHFSDKSNPKFAYDIIKPNPQFALKIKKRSNEKSKSLKHIEMYVSDQSPYTPATRHITKKRKCLGSHEGSDQSSSNILNSSETFKSELHIQSDKNKKSSVSFSGCHSSPNFNMLDSNSYDVCGNKKSKWQPMNEIPDHRHKSQINDDKKSRECETISQVDVDEHSLQTLADDQASNSILISAEFQEEIIDNNQVALYTDDNIPSLASPIKINLYQKMCDNLDASLYPSHIDKLSVIKTDCRKNSLSMTQNTTSKCKFKKSKISNKEIKIINSEKLNASDEVKSYDSIYALEKKHLENEKGSTCFIKSPQCVPETNVKEKIDSTVKFNSMCAEKEVRDDDSPELFINTDISDSEDINYPSHDDKNMKMAASFPEKNIYGKDSLTTHTKLADNDMISFKHGEAGVNSHALDKALPSDITEHIGSIDFSSFQCKSQKITKDCSEKIVEISQTSPIQGLFEHHKTFHSVDQANEIRTVKSTSKCAQIDCEISNDSASDIAVKKFDGSFNFQSFSKGKTDPLVNSSCDKRNSLKVADKSESAKSSHSSGNQDYLSEQDITDSKDQASLSNAGESNAKWIQIDSSDDCISVVTAKNFDYCSDTQNVSNSDIKNKNMPFVCLSSTGSIKNSSIDLLNGNSHKNRDNIKNEEIVDCEDEVDMTETEESVAKWFPIEYESSNDSPSKTDIEEFKSSFDAVNSNFSFKISLNSSSKQDDAKLKDSVLQECSYNAIDSNIGHDITEPVIKDKKLLSPDSSLESNGLDLTKSSKVADIKSAQQQNTHSVNAQKDNHLVISANTADGLTLKEDFSTRNLVRSTSSQICSFSDSSENKKGLEIKVLESDRMSDSKIGHDISDAVLVDEHSFSFDYFPPAPTCSYSTWEPKSSEKVIASPHIDRNNSSTSDETSTLNKKKQSPRNSDNFVPSIEMFCDDNTVEIIEKVPLVDVQKEDIDKRALTVTSSNDPLIELQDVLFDSAIGHDTSNISSNKLISSVVNDDNTDLPTKTLSETTLKKRNSIHTAVVDEECLSISSQELFPDLYDASEDKNSTERIVLEDNIVSSSAVSFHKNKDLVDAQSNSKVIDKNTSSSSDEMINEQPLAFSSVDVTFCKTPRDALSLAAKGKIDESTLSYRNETEIIKASNDIFDASDPACNDKFFPELNFSDFVEKKVSDISEFNFLANSLSNVEVENSKQVSDNVQVSSQMEKLPDKNEMPQKPLTDEVMVNGNDSFEADLELFFREELSEKDHIKQAKYSSVPSNKSTEDVNPIMVETERTENDVSKLKNIFTDEENPVLVNQSNELSSQKMESSQTEDNIMNAFNVSSKAKDNIMKASNVSPKTKDNMMNSSDVSTEVHNYKRTVDLDFSDIELGPFNLINNVETKLVPQCLSPQTFRNLYGLMCDKMTSGELYDSESSDKTESPDELNDSEFPLSQSMPNEKSVDDKWETSFLGCEEMTTSHSFPKIQYLKNLDLIPSFCETANIAQHEASMDEPASLECLSSGNNEPISRLTKSFITYSSVLPRLFFGIDANRFSDLFTDSPEAETEKHTLFIDNTLAGNNSIVSETSNLTTAVKNNPQSRRKANADNKSGVLSRNSSTQIKKRGRKPLVFNSSKRERTISNCATCFVSETDPLTSVVKNNRQNNSRSRREADADYKSGVGAVNTRTNIGDKIFNKRDSYKSLPKTNLDLNSTVIEKNVNDLKTPTKLNLNHTGNGEKFVNKESLDSNSHPVSKIVDVKSLNNDNNINQNSNVCEVEKNNVVKLLRKCKGLSITLEDCLSPIQKRTIFSNAHSLKIDFGSLPEDSKKKLNDNDLTAEKTSKVCKIDCLKLVDDDTFGNINYNSKASHTEEEIAPQLLNKCRNLSIIIKDCLSPLRKRNIVCNEQTSSTNDSLKNDFQAVCKTSEENISDNFTDDNVNYYSNICDIANDNISQLLNKCKTVVSNEDCLSLTQNKNDLQDISTVSEKELRDASNVKKCIQIDLNHDSESPQVSEANISPSKILPSNIYSNQELNEDSNSFVSRIGSNVKFQSCVKNSGNKEHSLTNGKKSSPDDTNSVKTNTLPSHGVSLNNDSVITKEISSTNSGTLSNQSLSLLQKCKPLKIVLKDYFRTQNLDASLYLSSQVVDNFVNYHSQLSTLNVPGSIVPKNCSSTQLSMSKISDSSLFLSSQVVEDFVSYQTKESTLEVSESTFLEDCPESQIMTQNSDTSLHLSSQVVSDFVNFQYQESCSEVSKYSTVHKDSFENSEASLYLSSQVVNDFANFQSRESTLEVPDCSGFSGECTLTESLRKSCKRMDSCEFDENFVYSKKAKMKELRILTQSELPLLAENSKPQNVTVKKKNPATCKSPSCTSTKKKNGNESPAQIKEITRSSSRNNKRLGVVDHEKNNISEKSFDNSSIPFLEYIQSSLLEQNEDLKRPQTSINVSLEGNNSKFNRSSEKSSVSSIICLEKQQVKSNSLEYVSYFEKKPHRKNNVKKPERASRLRSISSLCWNNDYVSSSGRNFSPEMNNEEVLINVNKKNTTKQKSPLETVPKCTVDSCFDIFPKGVALCFKTLEQIVFTEDGVKFIIHYIANGLSDAAKATDNRDVILYILKYLSMSQRNPIAVFRDTKDPSALLPLVESCLASAILIVNSNLKDSDWLPDLINVMYQMILSKASLSLFALCSMCRVLIEVCKQLQNKEIPITFACDVLKMKHKYSIMLITYIVGLWPELFYLPLEAPAPSENEVMMSTIPLLIFAAQEGWQWAKDKLLEPHIIPAITAYSELDTNEKALTIFCNLYAEICFFSPDGTYPELFLMNCFEKHSSDVGYNLIQDATALTSLKLIVFRGQQLPQNLADWIAANDFSPKVSELYAYFQRKLMHSKPDISKKEIF
nr:uncharacterized protein LOC107449294 isoform X2 [Parasteatoda tepidariorum]